METLLSLVVLAWNFFTAHFTEFMLVFILITLNSIARANYGVWRQLPESGALILPLRDVLEQLKKIESELNCIKLASEQSATINYVNNSDYRERLELQREQRVGR